MSTSKTALRGVKQALKYLKARPMLLRLFLAALAAAGLITAETQTKWEGPLTALVSVL